MGEIDGALDVPDEPYLSTTLELFRNVDLDFESTEEDKLGQNEQQGPLAADKLRS